MWIECESSDGTTVWFNSAHIVSIRPSDDNALLTLADGTSETVKTEPDLIARWLIEGKATA